MQTWLLVDGTYMAHRARVTTGGLAYGGVPTGIAFGLIRDIEILIGLHNATIVVLAFDHPGIRIRAQMYPRYKSHRKPKTDEEQEEMRAFYIQLNKIKKETLPEIGYRNILEVEGYEADDILAYLALNCPSSDRAVIVSADKDLWQCVRPNVICFNPTTKKSVTVQSFIETWNLEPHRWAEVKALAGCPSDGVEGIDGIAEVSAASYLAGTLKPTTSRYRKIVSNLAVLQRNLPLVRLPMPGLVLPEIRFDELSEEKRAKVRRELGFKDRLSDRAKEKSRKLADQRQEGFEL